jgi:hypothetical protein
MGTRINIMGSLAAPQLDWATENRGDRERIGGTVAALLGLAGVTADPVRSGGHSARHPLRTVLAAGQRPGPDPADQRDTNPPVKQLGAFEVDTFYPAKERFELAMQFNTLLASPRFQSWLQGEPLDIDRLFFTADGKPRHSILYIAHLSDSERMFIVTLLLESLVTWMRKQSGTTSLQPRCSILTRSSATFRLPPSPPPNARC